ncbi:tyrosine-type recombinase/integrase [Amycolatopsis sp. NPDC051128]|uniref:tyrosine-type recombinase/integrase n=1 Tax=Amycolatopsis sp. NPDC051128 TaxID=3155412 RepID=UPI0034250BA0
MSVVTGFYRTCVIDTVLEHSPAEYVRRPTSHQSSACHTCSSSPADRGAGIGQPVRLRAGGDARFTRPPGVRGRGKVVLAPLPPAVGRAIDRAVGDREHGPVLLNRRGVRMDRHCATRRLRRLAESSVVRLPRMHPHMLRHTFVTTMLDAGVDLRDVQIAARHADPRTTMRYDRARKNLDRHPNYILAAYMASAT